MVLRMINIRAPGRSFPRMAFSREELLIFWVFDVDVKDEEERRKKKR